MNFSLLPSAQATEWEEAVYYVAPNGNDSHAGTLEAPWKTIQKAADTLEAGDTALVRGGVYKEFVTITTSGSKNEYIQFKAYPGEQPVLDGKGMDLTSGKSALMYVSNASYIMIDGFELRNAETDTPDAFPAGIRVREGGHHIQLINNDVHHISNSSKEGNAHGIHIYGNSTTEISDILIKGNDVHHLTLGSSEALTVSGNVNGFVIEGNRVHDNNNIGIDIAGFYGACEYPCVDQARNGRVVDNEVFNNSSVTNPAYDGHYSAGGIYADGATDIIIEKNEVYHNDFGVELASENEGKTTSHIQLQDNVIYKNNGAGIIMGGASSSNGGTSNNRIMNNTLKHNDRLKQGYGEITLQWNNFDNYITSNKIHSKKKSSVIQQDSTSGAGNVIENNDITYSATLLDFFERVKKMLRSIF